MATKKDHRRFGTLDDLTKWGVDPSGLPQEADEVGNERIVTVSTYNDPDGGPMELKRHEPSGLEWWQRAGSQYPDIRRLPDGSYEAEIPVDRYYDASGNEQIRYEPRRAKEGQVVQYGLPEDATGGQRWLSSGVKQEDIRGDSGGFLDSAAGRALLGVGTAGLSEAYRADPELFKQTIPAVATGLGTYLSGGLLAPALMSGGLAGLRGSFTQGPTPGIPGMPSSTGIPGVLPPELGGLGLPKFDIGSLASLFSKKYDLPAGQPQAPQAPSGGGRSLEDILGAIRGAAGKAGEFLGGAGGQALGGLAGAGLLGAGLAMDVPTPSLAGVYEGTEAETGRRIQQALEAEQARRQAEEGQFLESRAATRSRLEDLLGQGTEQALQRSLQSRMEQLNRQGLLSGPSGALDYALAQEAGKIRREALPTLLGFEQETGQELERRRMGGLEGSLGLTRSGLEREFGVGDLRRQASLQEKLLESEEKAAKRRALLGAGAAGIGYGFGGTEGMKSASGVFRDIYGQPGVRGAM